MFIISLISFRTGLRHYSDKTYQNSNMIWDTFANGHTCMLSNNSMRWHCSLSGEWLSWQLGGVANKQYLLHNQCTVNLPTSNNQQPKINPCFIYCVCAVNVTPLHKQQAKARTKNHCCTYWCLLFWYLFLKFWSLFLNWISAMHFLTEFLSWTFETVFLNWISQLNFSNAFLNWIFQLYQLKYQ